MDKISQFFLDQGVITPTLTHTLDLSLARMNYMRRANGRRKKLYP